MTLKTYLTAEVIFTFRKNTYLVQYISKLLGQRAHTWANTKTQHAKTLTYTQTRGASPGRADAR